MEEKPNARRAARKTISTSSPVTDMFRKLSHNVGPEVKASQLSNAERAKLINMTRAKPEVPPPQWFRLTEEELYHGGKLPDHDLLKKHLREEGRLTLNCALKLLGQAAELLREEPNMLNLSDKLPIRICGDIHGQFYDLLNLVEMAGDPRKDCFLFLGDYVDRGMFSTEVVLYLAALKINFPKNVFMLRGNHECRLLTSHFNFMDECVHKYDSEVYYSFMELFDVLPIAAFIENDIGRFLLVHGGISPELLDLSQINEIDRFVEPPGEGLLCDLLWSDPIDEATGDGLNPQEMLEWDAVDYVPNPDRGCSWVFGYSAIAEFLEQLNLVSVIRAHEVQKAGFREHRFLKQREHPHLITVFSAPNYCLAQDHEILTNRGFLSMSRMQEEFAKRNGLLVAGYDQSSGQIVYESPLRVIVNNPEPNKKVVAFSQQAANVSVVVTQEHNMFVKMQDKSTFEKVRADELLSENALQFLTRATQGEPELRAWLSSLMDERGCVYGVQGELMRDQLCQAGLHAGYSVSFERTHDGSYCVSFDGSGNGLVNLSASKDNVKLVDYDGPTWCVTVPSGLIWTRRVVVDDSSGLVVQASRPIITGNCDMYNNKAAFMLMCEDRYEYKQTVHVGHPYYLPNFMDGLTYSLPFVMENLSRLAEDLMTICLPKADEPIPEDEKEEVEHLRGKILALSRLRHVMGSLGDDRRQSIKQPAIEPPTAGKAGPSPAQLAKFEAALQMDFMKEYLKPGAELGQGSSKAPLYRGRSRSLNFLELGKTLGTTKLPASVTGDKNQKQSFGPPRPNFLKTPAGGTVPPKGDNNNNAAGASGDELEASPNSRRSSGRRERAKAVKFGKPPSLETAANDQTQQQQQQQDAQMSKKEKRRSKDDWSVGK